MSQRVEAKQLARHLRGEGFQVVLSGRGHWKVLFKGKHVTTYAHSPSDMRWKKNTMANIRRWERGHGIAAKLVQL